MEKVIKTTEKVIKFTENQLNVCIEVSKEGDVRLLHLSTSPFPTDMDKWEDSFKKSFRLVELQFTGFNNQHKGIKHTNTSPGSQLIYVKDVEEWNQYGRLLSIVQLDKGTNCEVTTHIQFYNGISVVSSWTTLTNKGYEPCGVEYVSSFALTGLNQQGDFNSNYSINNTLYIPHNNWTAEAQWEFRSLKEWGLDYWVDGEKKQASTKRISIHNSSSWSCSEFSPNGILQNNRTNQTNIWQIETNGAWQWEITDIYKGDLLTLRLSGPTEYENSWWKKLNVGESFTSIKVAFGSVTGNYQDAIREMTKYRRVIRRKNADNENLPVIFNDYMNGLAGDPTTDKLLPLIDAAKEAGCEYFVIDCGWYSPGYWWDSVGEWTPSKERFPNGIHEVLNYIHSRNMVPGLWLEIEVMGINCKLVNQLPDNWFFMRHGKKIIDASRYHLDFRNPEVREYATTIIDRLVQEYGVGYIKMDYNITTGIGTDQNSDSVGDGLLLHNRAYLNWIDSIFEKYPTLIIENCGSGGMRHDYAMLLRHSIQSLTDQTDYLKNGIIAAAGSSVVAPEQSAVWSYPLIEGDMEEVIYNMTNAMLSRIHQSGHLAKIQRERFKYIKEGISVYKTYREEIKDSLPIWPTGLPRIGDEWCTFGLETLNSIYLAVWRTNSSRDEVIINLKGLSAESSVHLIYPVSDSKINFSLNNVEGKLTIFYPHNRMARLFKISK